MGSYSIYLNIGSFFQMIMIQMHGENYAVYLQIVLSIGRSSILSAETSSGTWVYNGNTKIISLRSRHFRPGSATSRHSDICIACTEISSHVGSFFMKHVVCWSFPQSKMSPTITDSDGPLAPIKTQNSTI